MGEEWRGEMLLGAKEKQMNEVVVGDGVVENGVEGLWLGLGGDDIGEGLGFRN